MFARVLQFGGLVVAAAGLLGGCGEGDSSRAVVRVGEATITQEQVDNYAGYMVLAANLGDGYTPPEFSGCVADLRTRDSGGNERDEHYRAQCAKLHRERLAFAAHSLLRREWVVQEAERLGVVVRESEVRKAQRLFATRNIDVLGPKGRSIRFRIRTEVYERKLSARTPVPERTRRLVYERFKNATTDGSRPLTSAQFDSRWNRPLHWKAYVDALERRYGKITTCVKQYHVKQTPECLVSATAKGSSV